MPRGDRRPGSCGTVCTEACRGAASRSTSERLPIHSMVQPSAPVSRIEGRTDMCLSTLRRFVEAIGGKLVIVAEFPDGAVRISQFAELERAS